MYSYWLSTFLLFRYIVHEKFPKCSWYPSNQTTAVKTTAEIDGTLRRSYVKFSNFYSERDKLLAIEQIILTVLTPNYRLKVFFLFYLGHSHTRVFNCIWVQLANILGSIRAVLWLKNQTIS